MSTIFRFGKKEKAGAYVNGLKEGKWTEFLYSYGTVETISNFKKDLKEGMELDFVFGKDTLYYKSDKLDGWQSFNRHSTAEKKYYDNGVLKKSVETNPVLSFTKECNYLTDNYECYSESKYHSAVRKEKITGNYKSRFEKTTTINDTIQHKIIVEKTETKDNLKFIADFYRNNQQYEKWEIIIPSREHCFNEENSKRLLDDDNYRIEYFLDGKKIGTAYKLECEIYQWLMYVHKVDFFVYDYSQDQYGYSKNFRKYKLAIIESDGDMLGGCVPEYIE
ncbi:MAG: hypothetical protein EOP00_35080 [Pedobacter sp.]|nr:MAG: hypothetical protein EOP00_35080 [Pedobacter sp.]